MADEPRVEQQKRSEHVAAEPGRDGVPLASGVTRALEGAVFPLERERLVWVARENDAPPEVLTALGGLPSGAFASLEEVLEQLGARGSGAPAGT